MKSWQTALARAETHPFELKPGSDYLCAHCGKTRAVHQFDGFIPNPERPHCSMNRGHRYNAHKYWYGLGWDRKKDDEEQEKKPISRQ